MIGLQTSTRSTEDRPETDDSHSTKSVLSMVRALAEARRLPTYEPILPLILSLRGKPYTLNEHFQFSPLFRTRRPKNTIYVCGRQVGKSFGLASSNIAVSAATPHFTSLYIAPLFEQTRKFSSLVVQPFIHESPVRNLWMGTNTVDSVLQRTFRNGARMLYSFANVDAGRVRGTSGVNLCEFDEADDIEPTVVPIIQETMAADKFYEMSLFAGTPKATDGPLMRQYEKSSQAEWWIPCTHCTTNGKPTWNICCSEYHLEKMLGPLRYDISPTNPALICYKCRKPVHSDLGHWEHRYRDRRWNYAGYHIPQPIIPLHYGYVNKWAALLSKQQNRSASQFANEVLGEARDSGHKLLSATELKSACSLPWKNIPDEPDPRVFERLKEYKTRVLAVDWGGGGEDGISYTVFALIGFLPDGSIEIPWGKRFLGTDHIGEAHEAMRWFTKLRCDMFTHDYGGAGTLRETFLIQAGMPLARNMPIQYTGSSRQDLLVPIPASETNHRAHWRLDKTRALHYTIAAIRLGRIRFFQHDRVDNDNIGLVEDFLQLVEHRTKLEIAGGDMYRIQSNGRGPDDFAQAVNIGVMATWYHNDAWPNFAQEASMQLTLAQMQAIGSPEFGWEQLGPDERYDDVHSWRDQDY